MSVQPAPSDPARQALLDDYRASPDYTGTSALPLIRALGSAWPPSIEALARDELMAELLVTTPIFPLGLERAMTAVRRRLLLEGAAPELLPFAARLAHQGHLNEHVWAIGAEERNAVAALAARVTDLAPIEAMLLAAYAPLDRFPGAHALLARDWGEPATGVLREQLVEPREERDLAARITALTPIREGVSAAVRAQYEANPYPRWRTVTARPPTSAIFGVPMPAAPEVLIAGCGTGYQAIGAAQRFPEGRVTAVDISLASLAFGQRKAREAGLSNLSFFQADLLEMGATGARFDVIEATGVLHHMGDPFEGARMVSHLLRPGGVIKLGLYSATARAKLKPAQALARTFAPEAIPELRQAIAAAPAGDPLREPQRFVDFYSTSTCRDLLMHVQEHVMDVSDLRRMLAENGLRFLGFTLGTASLDAYRQAFPSDPAATDLTCWEAFEKANPDTFLDMYQFWAFKPG